MCCDSAVVAGTHDRPPAIGGLHNLDHTTYVSSHFSQASLGRHRVGILLRHVRKHEDSGNVLVVHAKQPPCAPGIVRRQCDKAQVIVVVAELTKLRRLALTPRIERRAVVEEWIAPADEYVGGVPGRDMVCGVYTSANLVEVEFNRACARKCRIPACCASTKNQSDGRCRQAPEERSTSETNVDDVVHRPLAVGNARIGGAVFRLVDLHEDLTPLVFRCREGRRDIGLSFGIPRGVQCWTIHQCRPRGCETFVTRGSRPRRAWTLLRPAQPTAQGRIPLANVRFRH